MNTCCLMLIVIFGLIFGSFLNCMAMRIVRGEDFINDRSRCRACSHLLGPADLVPVISWMISGGKCRYCKKPIGIRYPVTEIVFAGLCAGVYLRFGVSAETIRNLIFTACLFTVSLTDLESYIIPDGVLLFGAGAWICFVPFMGTGYTAAVTDVLSALVCGGVLLGLSLALDRILKKESLGGGDIKLFALLALYLGILGAYFLIILSCLIGLIFAGVRRLMNMDGAIPFGPALAAAGYIMLLYGDFFIARYMNLL